MTHPYQKSIDAANVIVKDDAYVPAYIDNGEPHSINANSLETAATAINTWLKGHNPGQGWMQFFSSIDYFDGNDRPWAECDNPPLMMEFTTETGAGLVRHVGGYDWVCSFIHTAEANNKNAEHCIAQDYHVCTAQDVFRRCLGSDSAVPKRLLYTRYWQSDPDGVLNPIANCFRGFDFGEEV